MKRLVPRDFTVPILVETERFRIRPLTIHDVVKDYDAVMTSREHLRATLPWGWPPEDLTLEQDLIDLGWHHKEFQMETSFDYAVMSPDESRWEGLWCPCCGYRLRTKPRNLKYKARLRARKKLQEVYPEKPIPVQV